MKNILVTGCSWVQRMENHNKKNINNRFNFEYLSYGGQGLWKIEKILKKFNISEEYDTVVVQLPTPIRNKIDNNNTTELFCNFVDSFNSDKEEKKAAKEMLDKYKQKIIEINKLHKNVVFFLYNVGGYPFRHPYDFGKNIDSKIINFLKDNDLNHIYLSFEGKKGYAIKEENNMDKEFWSYYYENWPVALKGDYNKKSSLIGAPEVLIQDPHPSQKADIEALNKLRLYIGDK